MAASYLKVRAMQIIYELEQEKRGVYAGAVGYFGYSGGLDTCIAIRTMLFKDGHVYLQAGGGIVHDSDPDAEWVETINKLFLLGRIYITQSNFFHLMLSLYRKPKPCFQIKSEFVRHDWKCNNSI